MSTNSKCNGVKSCGKIARQNCGWLSITPLLVAQRLDSDHFNPSSTEDLVLLYGSLPPGPKTDCLDESLPSLQRQQCQGRKVLNPPRTAVATVATTVMDFLLIFCATTKMSHRMHWKLSSQMPSSSPVTHFHQMSVRSG